MDLINSISIVAGIISGIVIFDIITMYYEGYGGKSAFFIAATLMILYTSGIIVATRVS
jgi:hypothetical protein